VRCYASGEQMGASEPDPARRRARRRKALAGAGAVLTGALIAAIALAGGSGTGSSPETTPAGTGAAPTATTPAATAPGTTATTAPPTATAPTTTSAAAGPGPPAKPAPTGEQFGVNVNRLFDDRTYTAQQTDSQLRAVRATGAMTARTDALWEAAEPTAPVGGVHHYDWSFDDAIAAALAQHGLQWLPIIDYSAPWAQSVPGVDHSPPSSAADYAAYAGALAARYGADGSFWKAHPELPSDPVQTLEVWNEPDNPTFWSPRVDPARYADLYVRARDAIAAADPSARVIVGGLTNVPSFIPAMIQARPDLREHIDGVAVHPYGATPLGVVGNVAKARQVLSLTGLGAVPLYVTEFGWTTHPSSSHNWLPERQRPRYISQTMASLGHLDCGVAAAILYTWVTPERDRDNGQDWFGIHSPSGAGTPDAAALASGLRRAAQPEAPIHLC
jgi:polysaccharide biosynthesis protein PslG